MKRNHKTIPLRCYFVDEAGDGTLFDRKGQVIVGQPGCSRYFMLGMLDVPRPAELSQALQDLRQHLLADPYFESVPSMQPAAKKTALFFHAKDDVPEVRREVFAVLKSFDDLRFYGIITDKLRVQQYVQARNQADSTYHYHPNELYDYLVRRLFRDRLHKDDAYEIHFAKRGFSDRTAALQNALKSARQNFSEKWGISSKSPIQVIPTTPLSSPCLQAADYFLWALQRLFEQGEERYLAYLWPSFRLVQDIDDRRSARYGIYYTQKKPLTKAALDGRK
jgi:hypothetical protein